MENKSITMLISAFLALIVGISLVGVVATQGNEVTETITISGETIDYTSAIYNGTVNITDEFTIANVPDGWRITGCPITSFDLYNDSGSLVLTTDYTFTASTGVITFENTNNINGNATNATTATYVYCDSEYLTQGWNRTIIKLVPGFFALALMGVGIGLFYGVMKNEGVLD